MWAGLILTLAVGISAIGCAPEQRVEALAAAETVSRAAAAGPESAESAAHAADSAEALAAPEARPADADYEAPALVDADASRADASTAEASTPVVDAVEATSAVEADARPSPQDRSGLRGADESPSALAAAVADKLANAQALAAARPTLPSATLTSETALQAAAPTPAPRVAVTAPRPVVSAGGWIELPNVRPIPSTYYNAVHQWDSIVNHWAAYYKIDPDLIRRIIYVESKGYQYAYNASTGVKGLMQITPSWFKAGENPYDPWTNIGKGAYILRAGYNAYHTWFLAVTWYCYGPLARYGGNVPTMYAGLIYSPIIRSL